MKCESEDQVEKLTLEFKAKSDDLNARKNELINKLNIEEMNSRKLSL